jgi:hypothetical protein
MFGSSARFTTDRRDLPGPGSYTPETNYTELLPSRRPVTAKLPKPGLGSGRYNHISGILAGEVMVYKQAVNSRLGPGCYPGAAVAPLGPKSYNILALDSMRRRNKVLAPQMTSPGPSKARSPLHGEPSSLIKRAREILAQSRD